MRIDSSFQFDDLRLVALLKRRNPQLYAKVWEVLQHAKDLLNTRIPQVFPNYTLHDIGHSYRIINVMTDLCESVEDLNDLEIALMILSAILHDIGMAATNEDIGKIKTDSLDLTDIKWNAMLRISEDENSAIREYVRKIHSKLSAKYIEEYYGSILKIPSFDSIGFSDELANICQSHTEDYNWIKSNLQPVIVKAEYKINTQFIAAILRIADILDIDSSRTPIALQNAIQPKGMSASEWNQHFTITNTQKIEIVGASKNKRIAFYGSCKKASIHRKILGYIDWVEKELLETSDLLSRMNNQYNFPFDTKPYVAISPEGYKFSNFMLKLNFKAITSLLMGEKIYGGRQFGLRELIQNSIDSCNIRSEVEAKNRKFGEDEYVPRIRLILNSERNSVVVSDNGCGMNQKIITNHFLSVGSSYYGSEDFQLRDLSYKPIGNFGIGFLACFMLSDEVKVITRNYLDKTKFEIELERGVEHTSVNYSEDITFTGTEIHLKYNEFMPIFDNDKDKIVKFLANTFITDAMHIEVIDQIAESRLRIQNSIALQSKPTTGQTVIDLGQYLNDIEGYAVLKKNEQCIKSIADIDFLGDTYFYAPDSGLIKLDNSDNECSIAIHDCFDAESDEFVYFEIPIIDSSLENEYSIGMSYTGGDKEDVIDKISENAEWISLLIPNGDETLREEIVSYRDEMMTHFNFDSLIDLGQDSDCSTKIYKRKLRLFESSINNLYMPYGIGALSDWRDSSKDNRLYIRNVLVKDFKYSIPKCSSLFSIERVFLNVKSRKIIPNVSRNDIDSHDSKILNYTIGKIIHKGAIDHLGLDEDAIKALNQFQKIHYSNLSAFEKL